MSASETVAHTAPCARLHPGPAGRDAYPVQDGGGAGFPLRISDHGAKSAAGKIGCTVEEYRQREANGERWCSMHREWHDHSRFRADAYQPTGLAPRCRAGRHSGLLTGARYRLTPEGAALVTSADHAWSERLVPSATAVPSGSHVNCPAALGCLTGQLPRGWVRAAPRAQEGAD